MLRKHRRLSVSIVLCSWGIVASSSAAWAGNVGSTACGGSPRTCASLSWYSGGLYRMLIHPSVGSNMAVELEWVMANAYPSSTTHLEMSRTYSSTSWETRAALTNQPLAPYVGWVECKPGSVTSGSHPSLRCGYQYLWLNSAHIDTVNGDSNYVAGIACHEIGHSVSLRHSSEAASCMQDPAIAFQWFPTNHDRVHLAARYS